MTAPNPAHDPAAGAAASGAAEAPAWTHDPAHHVPHHHHEPVSERRPHPVAVSVRDVTKIFDGSGGRGGTTAVEQVSFDIHMGEFVSLIGPSGCGKSTLLRLVSGLVGATDGSISVNGLTPAEARKRRQFGVVFQSPVLFDWRTVAENIALPLQVFGEPKSKIRPRVEELAALVGLEKFTQHYPWQLSGGMQQRVAIARALTFAPPFLLMDEPFGALDLITRDRMAEELLRIWANTPGTTVMFITHSIPEAVLLSDRVVVMGAHPGRVVKVVDIDLPRPRTEAVRESRAFFEYDTQLRRMLIDAEAGGA
jgi:NitT/TauT family transport system ATP-binding protein